MTAPVLTDLAGREFTEGDYVVYSSTNGIRYGKVEWIKHWVDYYKVNCYKVYINLDFHRNLTKEPGKMYAKKQGYEYNAGHFLKISPIT